MNKQLILLLFVSILFSTHLVSAIDFGYNRLYTDGNNIIPDFNYSVNVNTSDNWNTGDHGTLRNVADISHNWLNPSSLPWSVAEHTIDTDVEYNNNGVKNVGESNFSGRVNFTTTDSNVDISAVSIKTTSNFGAASQRFLNADNDKLVIGIFSKTISNLLFPNLVNENQSVGGITMGGGKMFMASQENNSIEIGNTPTQDITLTEFYLRFDPLRQGITFQGDKHIQPKIADGGNALVFDSEDVLSAGGFPFVFEAQDSDNETVILSWQQNGANNSFSGNMNSFVTVPKSWIESTIPRGNTDNVTFLFNTSNYLQLCDWLQTNLSLIPEGCKYFADTSGRGVPLIAGGDAEFWRTMTVHEGALIYDDFDYVTREGNEFDIIGGDVHIQRDQNILENVTFINQFICDFNTDLCGFINAGTPIDPVNQWNSVADADCPVNAPSDEDCAGANGALREMQFSEGTQLSNYTNITFYYTTNFQGVGSEFYIELDNNEGDSTTVFSQTVAASDEFESFIFPAAYLNKPNVTVSFFCDAKNILNNCFVDDVRVFATFSEPIIINATEQMATIVMGESGGIDECGIYEYFEIIENTTQVQKVMELGCPTGVTRFLGNASFVDTTVVNQTILGELNVEGNAIIAGNVTAANFNGNWNGSSNYIPYINANKDVDLGENALALTEDITINSTGSANNGIILRHDARAVNTGIKFEDGSLSVGIEPRILSGYLGNGLKYIGDEHTFQGNIVLASGKTISGNPATLISSEVAFPSSMWAYAGAPGYYLKRNPYTYIEFPDGYEARFGTGQDSWIEDTGSNMEIDPDVNSVGSRPLKILGDVEMGVYDLNVSTLYYDTLTAKSPIFQCSDNWCSIGFPKHQKTLWIQKDESWNIQDIVYDGTHYTKQEFNQQICQNNPTTQDICSRLNIKIAKLKAKAECLNNNHQWDGTCYEMITITSTYNEAVESYQQEIMNITGTTCTQLNSQLQVEQVSCSTETPTGEFETRYKFKDDCGWDKLNYYCRLKQEVQGI